MFSYNAAQACGVTFGAGAGGRSVHIARASADTATDKVAKFKKGDKVRIKRGESYWYNDVGSVVTNVQNEDVRYPYTIRFEKVNYAGMTTNNFAENELEAAN